MGDGFSVLILTCNEELTLPGCLESLRDCEDVVVLDSFSKDQTKQVAESFGVRLFQRKFDNYAGQRNYGLNNLEFIYPWIFFVDADERATPELLAEIRMVLSKTSDDTGLFRMRRKDYLQGRWLKHSSGYPTWFGRLVRKGAVLIEREINEEYVTEKRIGLLRHHLDHFPFARGMSHWLNKHNTYSTMEADLLYSRQQAPWRMSHLFSRDPAMRRKAMKALVYRMPMRPIVVFLALYLLRGGFLDGRQGLMFCLLRSFYELMINCKVAEMKWNKRDQGTLLG